MAVSGQQELFHSLWFSSSLRRTGHSSISSPLSRKKGRHYGQGQIAQFQSFHACSSKCTQPTSLATRPVTLKHCLTLEDNSPPQQLQSSSSGFKYSPCKYVQMNQLSTYGMSGRGRVSEMIGYSSRSDRSQMHTSSAITGDGTIALENLSPSQISFNSRKAWHDSGDWYGHYYAYYASKNGKPIKAATVVHDVEKEESASYIFKDPRSYKICPLPTSNSDLLVQQSAHEIIVEKTEKTSNAKQSAHGIIVEKTEQTSNAKQSAHRIIVEKSEQTSSVKEADVPTKEIKENLAKIYEKILVVDNVTTAKQIVRILTKKYRNLIHACDTEVSRIDVKQETPVDHGEIICFSIYSGPQAEFGNGKSYIWVDVMDGGHDVLMEFAPFFEDPKIKKVWHNYSFDSHIIESHGIKLSGFYADTMHLARLWDSSRKLNGGYSLEALTSDPIVMSRKKSRHVDEFMGKISMKSMFGKRKVKKDGSEGKSITMAPVELIQREELIPWICYSVLDSISTLRLFESLKEKLEAMDWVFECTRKGSMYKFYEEYWRPFGTLLVNMEAEGLLVDRAYLSDVEKIAIAEQQLAADRFRRWASTYCPDAKYMNVGSDTQTRQLFFGGISNRKYQELTLPISKTFKVPNVENVIEDGYKKPSKYRNITLHSFAKELQAEIYTASGWPSVSGDALKTFAGKISPDCIYLMDGECGLELKTEQNPLPSDVSQVSKETSIYGTAYDAFGGGKEGKDACHAIAALCEVCSIDSLISNFILPLQGTHISGKDGRIHCSLNINTETGRLSARRPNLQNQPALEKDRYKIRQAFIAGPGNSLIVADYGQLELRILAHLANCKSMLDAFKAGGDFHSRTAMNMYAHVHEAVEDGRVLLEWYPQRGVEKPPVPLLKDAFAAERRKAKTLNFSIAYGKTPLGLSKDWKVSLNEAKETVRLWYNDRKEVLKWQQERKKDVLTKQCVHTLLGRARRFPSIANASYAHKGHIERAAINTPVQGSAADVAMCAMLEIDRNARLKELGWRLLLQIHDEVILEGPTESSEIAKAIVIECMSKPFFGANILKVDLVVDAKCAQNWYAAK
ncbi:hypothetical protein KSP39_PZI003355 [Platanthera zijinensis]|uniref:DNA-directed DNA polymerase n=1 Tax=Platanthera zijinensis TaxID=2320716 RepID=A0AAP0GCD0_9ASPA